MPLRRKLEQLTATSRQVAEIANVRIIGGAPFIGKSAFAHKGGMHIDGGVQKIPPRSFEHIDPLQVGNERRLLMSEVAGRALMLKRIARVIPDLDKDDPVTVSLMDELKQLEADGYQFEGAESSFDLVIRRHLKMYKPISHWYITRPLAAAPPMQTHLATQHMLRW